ncbi:MAG: hypothetical protein ACTHKG_06660 [Nocardioides sp.]
MSPTSIDAIYLVAGPGGVGETGSGLISGTSWLIGAVFLALLIAVGWWSTTKRKR